MCHRYELAFLGDGSFPDGTEVTPRYEVSDEVKFPRTVPNKLLYPSQAYEILALLLNNPTCLLTLYLPPPPQRLAET